MSRKNMPLVIGGAVTLLLAAVLAYVLFSARGRYIEARDGLATAQSRLGRLLNRPVFPSKENVDTMSRQLDIYEDYLDGLFQAMRKGQREPEAIDRDRFRQLLEQTLRRLVQTARSRSIALPADFAFGFQRYASGILPEETDLSRLVDQLQSVALLCEGLYEAGIGELVSIERTIFERDAQAAAAPAEEEYTRRSRRGTAESEAASAPVTDLVVDPDGLFSKEHYVLTYRAQDEANWKVLERLSRGAPFTIITKVEVTNSSRPAVVPPKAEGAPAGATAGVTAGGPARPGASIEPEILPRELRVVAGQELALVRLELDVYRFLDSAAEEGEVQP